MGKLPAHLPRPSSLLAHRPSVLPSRTSSVSPSAYNSSTPQTISHIQSRAATFVPRPRRPYTFTQMVQLSDGSTFTLRSTSPTPLVRSAKDTRNHALWQPTDQSLKNVEVDEAGKLAAFRERFGRGFDLAADANPEETPAAAAAAAESSKSTAAAAAPEEDPYDLGDLISGYAAAMPAQEEKPKPKKADAVKGKKK